MASHPAHRVVLLAAALTAIASPARAGWQPDGVLVCLHPAAQLQPLLASDGFGGAYVVWSDNRVEWDLYFQHLTASGDIAPGWPESGLPLCTALGAPAWRDVAPDGQGGLLATWSDARNNGLVFDIYAQRMTAAGSPAPGWPVDGVRVTDLPSKEDSPVIVSDGSGGAFVAWWDIRNGNGDLYAMHLLADGSRAPGWPENGLPISTGPFAEGGQVLMPDGAGGVLIVWGYGTASGSEFRVLHLTASGEPAPGWPAGGKVVFVATQLLMELRMVCDGAGGGYLAWVDFRTAPPGTNPYDAHPYADIYCQRFTAAGDIAPGWPASGLALCTQPRTQWALDLAADGAGGCIVAWVDYRTSLEGYAVRVTETGALAPGWAAQGTRVGTGGMHRIAADGVGGVYVLSDRIDKLVAQHLTGAGQVAPGWPLDGLRLVQGVGGSQQRHVAISDGRGGAIVGWEDGRVLNKPDIYAQRVGVDGPTPVLVSLVSAEAEAGLVRLTWYAGGEPSWVADVHRRGETGDWEVLATVAADGSGMLRYEDRSVVAGTRYAYRLTYRDGAETVHTEETWVTVPALRFALRGLTPNPSAGDPVVSFSLASDESATLELFDLHGRLVLSHEAGAPGPGVHTVRLEGRGRLPAGVYTVRLRQGASVATTRAVIVR